MPALGASAPASGSASPPPFELSGLPGLSRGFAVRPAFEATSYSAATLSPGAAGPAVGANVNVIGSNDAVQQGTINGVTVRICNPGKEAAQNETTIAANPGNPGNLVAGANDYRLYEPTENRYDASGGVYRSVDGGATWSAAFLPGLVRANAAAPGPYEAAGDPAVAAGPAGTFWYANLAFNRTDAANAVAASRSTDGGKTWATSYVLQTSAAGGLTVFNDKEWIAGDPSNPDVAYVTWTQYVSSIRGTTTSTTIVISKTVDAGKTWSAPVEISGPPQSSGSRKATQGSTVIVDESGTVHVTFETTAFGHNWVAYATSTDGGATFSTRLLAIIADIPSPLPGATYRNDSFPGFAMDGSTLHVVWSNWNGSNASIAYIRSSDGGETWSGPVTISGSTGDQLFPWVAAHGGKVYATWFNRAPGGGNTYAISGAASTNDGASWSAPVTVSTAISDVSAGNRFGYPACPASFVGDYSGITVDSTGVAHSLWTDVRVEPSTPTDPGGTSQDPFTATLSAS
jgi:hypothetical protein